MLNIFLYGCIYIEPILYIYCIYCRDTPGINGKCLVISTWHVLERLGVFRIFEFSPAKFLNWLQKVENGYLNNPYHNKIHATDVMSNTAYFVSQTEFCKVSVCYIDII